MACRPSIHLPSGKKNDLCLAAKETNEGKKVAKVLIVLASERLGRSHTVEEFEKVGLHHHHHHHHHRHQHNQLHYQFRNIIILPAFSVLKHELALDNIKL